MWAHRPERDLDRLLTNQLPALPTHHFNEPGSAGDLRLLEHDLGQAVQVVAAPAAAPDEHSNNTYKLQLGRRQAAAEGVVLGLEGEVFGEVLEAVVLQQQQVVVLQGADYY